MFLCGVDSTHVFLLTAHPWYGYPTAYTPAVLGWAFGLFPIGAVMGKAALGIDALGFCTHFFWDHRSKCER